MVVFVVVLFCCCCLLQTLSDFDVLFLKIEALDELRKMLSGKKLFSDFPTWHGPWIGEIILNFCRFTKMQLS